MKKLAGVVVVNKDETQTADTSDTTSFLGLDADGGLGTARRRRQGREDVIIGIVDSGIWR